MEPNVVSRRWPLMLLLLLLPLYAVGLFARGFWTPDEPRDSAIAARMADPGSDWAVPHLGHEAFCEKPPLWFWGSAWSMSVFGRSPAAARLPNLAFALAGILAVAWLAQAMAGARREADGGTAEHDPAALAALAAGVFMGTSMLCYRIEIWALCDAALVPAVAGALLGLYRGLHAPRGGAKLGWYALMHICLALGFLSKNVIAWIVPGLALVAYIAWQRRWRELFAWELWLGLVAQVACILPWVRAVAAEPDGAYYLKRFFVDNLLGRFVKLEGVEYADGHRRWLGKYLVELPLYLLPWTALAVAALRRAWSACRHDGRLLAAVDGPAPWRFALAVIVPATLLLSAAATKREIYYGPVMPGFALLTALWVVERAAAGDRFERAMLWLCATVLAGLAALAPPAVVALSLLAQLPVPWPGWLAVALGAALAWPCAWWSLRALRRGEPLNALAGLAALLVLLLIGNGPALMAMADRSQDLGLVAAAVARTVARHPLVIYRADETIVGVLDFHSRLVLPVISADDQAQSVAELRGILAADAGTRVLVRDDARHGRDSQATQLAADLGLTVEERIDIPYGRAYVILAKSASVSIP